MAAAIVLMWPDPASLPVVADAAPTPGATKRGVETPAMVAENPLEREKLALENDVRRAGRFLIDCLPSLTSPLD